MASRALDTRGRCPSWEYIGLQTLTPSTWVQPAPLRSPCWARRWGWGSRSMKFILKPCPHTTQHQRAISWGNEELKIFWPRQDDESTFPRYLIITSTEEQPINLSIFVIQNYCHVPLETSKVQKSCANGSILVEVRNRNQTDTALQMTNWVSQPVKVTAHRSLNTSRGIFHCRDFRDCDEAEVLNALNARSVTSAKRWWQNVTIYWSPRTLLFWLLAYQRRQNPWKLRTWNSMLNHIYQTRYGATIASATVMARPPATVRQFVRSAARKGTRILSVRTPHTAPAATAPTLRTVQNGQKKGNHSCRMLECRYRRSRSTTDCRAWSMQLELVSGLLRSKKEEYWLSRLETCSRSSTLSGRQCRFCSDVIVMSLVRRVTLRTDSPCSLLAKSIAYALTQKVFRRHQSLTLHHRRSQHSEHVRKKRYARPCCHRQSSPAGWTRYLRFYHVSSLTYFFHSSPKMVNASLAQVGCLTRRNMHFSHRL